MEAISKLVLAFVTLIIGAVLIAQVADVGLTKTTKTLVSSEVVDFTNARVAGAIGDSGRGVYSNWSFPLKYYIVSTNWRNFSLDNCDVDVLSVTNGTKTLTVTTDYVTTSQGYINFQNSTNMRSNSNTSYVTYTYCPDDYMDVSWGRSAIDLIPGFFGIAMLLIAVGLFYSIARDAGLMGK